ncbi:hypothetical protein J7M28_09730 [bacterium]|nr:hypothetical protein [bacterium]
MSITKHASHIALALILILASYMRLEGLGENSLWVDERIVGNLAESGDVMSVLHCLEEDIHPPLLHLIAHFTMKLGGRSEFALRLPSALFGIAACFAVPIVLIGLLNVSQHTRPKLTDARGMALYIRRSITSDAIVADVAIHDAPGFEFYLREACPDYPSDRIVLIKRPRDLERNMGRIAKFKRFWLISIEGVPSPLLALAQKHLRQVKVVRYYKVSATLFTWPEDADRAPDDTKEVGE